MTDYDQQHIPEILKGEGDWFTARLFRLIACSDKPNKRKLSHIYPNEVDVIHSFQTGETLAGNEDRH